MLNPLIFIVVYMYKSCSSIVIHTPCNSRLSPIWMGLTFTHVCVDSIRGGTKGSRARSKMLCHHFLSHILYIVKLRQRLSKMIPRDHQTKLYGYDQCLKLHYYFKLEIPWDPTIFNLQHSNRMWDTPMMTQTGMGASHMEY